jgi:predicted transcriptional regulator
MSTVVTCRLDADLLDGLDHHAARAGVGRSAAIEQILRRHLGVARPPPGDRQTRDSGAAANGWGRATAGAVARSLGAARVAGEPANIFRLEGGERVLIKNSRGRGDRINILPGLLDRFETVYAGFWSRDGERCELFAIPAAVLADCAREVTRGRFLQIDRRTVGRLGLRPTVLRADDLG